MVCGCAAAPRADVPPGRALAPPAHGIACHARGALPDPGCTPGSVLTDSAARVCTPGYARSVRNVGFGERRTVYRSYGIRFHLPGSYQIDHLVPLELGGANDTANLWPQRARPAPGNYEKDRLENALHALVCSGRMGLSSAQRAIARDWVSLWVRLGRP